MKIVQLRGFKSVNSLRQRGCWILSWQLFLNLKEALFEEVLWVIRNPEIRIPFSSSGEQPHVRSVYLIKACKIRVLHFWIERQFESAWTITKNNESFHFCCVLLHFCSERDVTVYIYFIPRDLFLITKQKSW